MKKYILFIVLVFFLVNLFSYHSILDWRYIKDDRFIVYYPQGQYLYAKYSLNSLKEYAGEVDNITGNDRKQKLNIILQDTGEFYNGSASPIENKLKLFLNTPSTHGSFTSQEWLNMLVIHEYTHHSHLTNAKKYPLLFSKIFGNVFSPNLYSPMWIVEGITVRNESNFSPYMGRLNNGYYTEILNAQLREGNFQNHISANYYLEDYPLGNYYVYGGAFVKWLGDQYGEEKLTEFFNYYGSDFRNVLVSSLFPKYTLDKAAKRVFGKRFPQLFAQWKKYLEISADFDKDLQTRNIPHNWDNTLLVNNITSDNKHNIYFFETAKYFNHYRNNIIRFNIEDASDDIIYSSNSNLSANLEIIGNTLYFAEEEGEFTGNNLVFGGYSGTSVLKKLNLADNFSSSIILSKAFKDFTVAENGVIFYTTEDINTMTSSLFKYTNNHHSLVKNFPFLLSELVYSNNKIYCTYKYTNSSWDIGEISLDNYTLSPVISTYSQEKNIHIYNNNLLFTSNQGNKSQAYKINLISKKLSKISNNFYADMPKIIADKLYYKSISGKGERVSIAELVDLKADLELVEDPRLITLMDDDYQEEVALGESFKQLLIPFVRYPLGILSSDGIGFFDVSMDWFITDEGGYFGADISTRIFSPLILKYSLSNQDDNYLSAQLRIYYSQINWLNSVDVIGTTDFDDSNLLGNQIMFRKFNSTFTNYHLYDLEARGFTNNAILTHNFKKAQLSLLFNRVYDYDKSPNFSEHTIHSGNSTYNDYGCLVDFNIFKVRDGFWTPNIAMKDIDLSLGLFQNDYESDKNITYVKVSAKTDVFTANALQFRIETGAYFNNKNFMPMIRIGSDF